MWCPARPSTVVKWNQSALRSEAVYAAEGSAQKMTQALWRSPEDFQWISVIECGIIHIVGVCFHFFQIVTALFLPF